MWATASAESQPRGFRLGLLVDVATGVLLVLLFAWMLEDQELRAIPYHLIFFVLILVYGYRVWPLPVTVGVVAAVTLMTGAVLVDQHRQGQLEEAEFAEVILMPMILAAMVWHARRRRQAQLALQRSLRAERDRVDAETQFLREAAHAIRNPIAVARGFLDLAEVAPRSDQDACRQTVRHELYRIDRIAAQLLDVAAHPDGALVDREVIDGSELARDALNRWRAVSDRRWVLDVSGPAWIAVAPDRLSDALDALVENALRFTNEGTRSASSAGSSTTGSCSASLTPGRVFRRSSERTCSVASSGRRHRTGREAPDSGWRSSRRWRPKAEGTPQWGSRPRAARGSISSFPGPGPSTSLGGLARAGSTWRPRLRPPMPAGSLRRFEPRGRPLRRQSPLLCNGFDDSFDVSWRSLPQQRRMTAAVTGP